LKIKPRNPHVHKRSSSEKKNISSIDKIFPLYRMRNLPVRSSTTTAQRLEAAAVAAGIAPARLIFASRLSPKVKHLERAVLADVALDTLVYNGHTTSSDMLWAGVPVITVRGDSWPSRVAASLAEALGVKEIVVDSLAQYEDLAVELAGSSLRLRMIKQNLTQQRNSAPLFDTKRWVANFESGLQEAWQRFDQGGQGDIFVRDLADGREGSELQTKKPRTAAQLAYTSHVRQFSYSVPFLVLNFLAATYCRFCLHCECL
jgi:hypothetical protein